MSVFGAEDGVTEVLDARVAAAAVDPNAFTQVVAHGPVIGPFGRPRLRRAGGHQSPAALSTATRPDPPTSLVSRRVAAETGMYLGAVLVLVAIGGVVLRGWPAWDPGVRWTFVGLATVALLATGMFVRLPWSRPVGAERRRAVSALLTSGVVVAATAAGVATARDAAAAPSTGSAMLTLGVLAALFLVNLVARTPASEVGLLAAIAWTAWLAAPPGPGTWACLCALGAVWAGLGSRVAQGRRTAAVAGASLALAASIGMAGAWAWPIRAALAAVAVFGLASFLRGGPNHRLALGAGAATALAASVAGAVVGPALALLVGGLATMAVSWIALRSARLGDPTGWPRLSWPGQGWRRRVAEDPVGTSGG